MRSVRVPIQAGKRNCGFCHLADRIYHRVDECEVDWCHLFARQLERDKKGPVRCDDCIRAETVDEPACERYEPRAGQQDLFGG